MKIGKDCFLSILVELGVVLLVALLAPLLIRYLLLPSAVHHQYPLNVVFHTCDHDLHSVCSYPAATLDYEKNTLFSPDVTYYLNIQLKFADVANSKMLGLFQNVITVSDGNGKLLKQYTRSAYVKEPGLIAKASHVFFFPLYFLGFFYDYSTLTIPMTADYRESSDLPSTKLTYTIKDKFANIEDAELIVTARFGLIRHLLYYWPTSSFAIIFVVVVTAGCFLITAKIGYKEYKARCKAAIAKDKAQILTKFVKKEEDTKKISKKVVKTEEDSGIVRRRNVVCGNVSVVMSLLSDHASTQQPCLGFCGRSLLFNSSDGAAETTSCGPCPFGWRNTAKSICEQCGTPLEAYDWMYLLFVALLPLLLHMEFIRTARNNRSRYFEISEHLCVVLENVIACVVSVLIYPPTFTFLLNGCVKTSWKEWYPACYNPRVGYTNTMRCTYEVVFPLYSITFAHHLVLIVAILLLRSTLYCLLLYKTYNGQPFYYAIVSVPILAAVHSVFAGFLFYSFPWIVLIGSLWAMVFNLAQEVKRPFKDMLVRMVTSPTHVVFLSIIMLLLSFSVVALITPLDSVYRWLALCMVPVPLVFYIVTIPFSNPTMTMRLI
ncbi:unnamed protein product [Caenorhabditis sp. 36 PRJEB53466]|nr:unnamed protein product [Caenorhabditis sp. 36 PRJEB53466]